MSPARLEAGGRLKGERVGIGGGGRHRGGRCRVKSHLQAEGQAREEGEFQSGQPQLLLQVLWEFAKIPPGLGAVGGSPP